MKKSLLVVDCQNDFISGSLACLNAENAVDKIVEFINYNVDFEVLFSLDWHNDSNKSFEVHGGIWPVHCVKNTVGANLHSKLLNNIMKPNNKPNETTNMFFKGIYDEVEEYSAFKAQNQYQKSLKECLNHEVIVCGIASEYCVKETINDLLKNGFKVSLYKEGIAYVNKSNHENILEELINLGVEII